MTAPQTVQQHPAIVLKREAVAQGLTRYFTGAPCTHGHISERSVSNGTCLACHNMRKKQHYVENKSHFSEYRKQWRLDNIDHVKQRNSNYYIENRDAIRLRQKEYAQVHRDVAIKRAKDWAKQNPDAVRAKVSKRRARLSKLVPSWYDEFDELVWRESSRLVKLRNRLTGIKWHADHIIPLHCQEASGFHVGQNCQVIPAKLNILKSNKLTVLTFSDWIFQS